MRRLRLRPVRRSGQRGQTVPFWAASVVLSMTLAMFAYNYSNTVRWQYRAQNAADSAATAIVGQDAAVANSVTTIQYATDIANLRDRSVNNDIAGLTTGLSGDTECAMEISTSCVTAYGTLTQTLTSDVQQYQNVVGSLDSFTGQFSGVVGSASSANSLVSNLYTANAGATYGCVKLNTDCNFHYTTTLSTGANGKMIVDEYACRAVPTIASGLFGLNQAAQQTFYAIGHARETLGPASDQTTNPGTMTNQFVQGNPLLQPPQTIDPNLSGSTNVINYSTLQLQTNYLVPQAAPPPSATSQTVQALCPA